MTEAEQFKQCPCVGNKKDITSFQPRKSLLDMSEILQKPSVGGLQEWTAGCLYHDVVQQQPMRYI